MSEEIKSLTLRRGQLKDQLTRCVTFIESFNERRNITELKLRLQKIEEIWVEFDKIQSLIEDKAPDDIEAQETEYKEFEDKYFEVISRAEEFLSSFSSNVVNNVDNSNSNSNSIGVSLPIINLSHFSGAYEEWLQFLEIFRSLMHENEKLTKIQKFFHLQSCLKGEASKILHSLEICEASYEAALHLLKERYENKRILIHNYVKNLYE